MSLSTEAAQIFKTTCQISYLELRLMNLSAEKQLKHAEGSAKTAMYSTEMTGKLNAIKDKLGDDPTSEEYRQNMTECESVENEYQTIIDNIRNQMEQAEEKIDTMQETVETQLEVLRSEQEQWKEARDNTCEKTFQYGNRN